MKFDNNWGSVPGPSTGFKPVVSSMAMNHSGSTSEDIFNIYTKNYKSKLKNDEKNKYFNQVIYSPPSYEGPCGLTSVLGQKFDENDIDTISIWGHAPHYLQIPHSDNN